MVASDVMLFPKPLQCHFLLLIVRVNILQLDSCPMFVSLEIFAHLNRERTVFSTTKLRNLPEFMLGLF